MAMYLMSSHKKGVSSCQMARDIRVTQKTAWFIQQKIRTLYAQCDTPALEGEIECDRCISAGARRTGTQDGGLRRRRAVGIVSYADVRRAA